MNAIKWVLLFMICFSVPAFGWNPTKGDFSIRPNEHWGEIFTWPQNEVRFYAAPGPYEDVLVNTLSLESADPAYPGYYLDFQGGASPGNTNAIIHKGFTSGSKWTLRTFKTGPHAGESILESTDPSYLGYYLDFQGGASPGNTNGIIHKGLTPGSYWTIHVSSSGKDKILLESADPSYPGYFLDFQGGASPGNTNVIIHNGTTPGSVWTVAHY